MPIACQVRMPHVDGIPEDVVVHTWNSSGSGSSTLAGAEDFRDWLFDFYATTPVGATSSPADYLADTIDWSLATFVAYDTSDPEPRVPLLTLPFVQAPNPVADNALPGEVALCLSYRADIASGQVAARRRGRVYWGPLNSGAVNLASGIDARPVNDLVNTLALSATELRSAGTPGVNEWSVWSRVDNVMRAVEAGWVDNAFDTQRRRGVSATSRTNWT